MRTIGDLFLQLFYSMGKQITVILYQACEAKACKISVSLKPTPSERQARQQNQHSDTRKNQHQKPGHPTPTASKEERRACCPVLQIKDKICYQTERVFLSNLTRLADVGLVPGM